MPLKRLACLLLIASAALFAQGKKKKGAGAADNPEAPQIVNLPSAKLGAPIAGERVSDAEKQSDWPAITTAADGSLYAVYVVWNDKDADSIVVRRRDPSGKWGEPVTIADGCWDHYWPAIVNRGNNALAIWSGQAQSGFDLYASEISPDGNASKPERLTKAQFSDFNVRAASDSAVRLPARNVPGLPRELRSLAAPG